MTNQCCSSVEKTWSQLNRMLTVEQLLQKQNELNTHTKVGPGWASILTVANFETAIIGEMGELIDQPSAPAYKWWKEKDPCTYSAWMTKLEIVDAAHFYLSIAILNILESVYVNPQSCTTPETMFIEFSNSYVGSDTHFNRRIGQMVAEPNALRHDVYMKVVKSFICDEWNFYGWVLNLGSAISSVGMTCEEFSALYTAKATLNEVRWDHPEWQKIDIMGVEDNDRLFPLVQTFLDTPTMDLATLRQNVLDEFYIQA